MLHNEYARFSGEERVVEQQVALLSQNGHQADIFRRESSRLGEGLGGRVRAFFSGLRCREAITDIRERLAVDRADVVHIHNLYPLISPAVLPVCAEAGVPVVMTVHNYRLVCPNGLHLSHGELCERCCGGREWWCFLKNCEEDLCKSLGYALRNWWARKRRYFLDHVSVFACLTEFQRDRLVAEGFDAAKTTVLPNMVPDPGEPAAEGDGKYVGYAGRVSREKGITALQAAARLCADLPFRVAGDTGRMPVVVPESPANMEFAGHMNQAGIHAFYAHARFLVVPSIYMETFGLVIVEAMLHGKPVIASRIGGIPEIVDDGETGILVEPGNATELADKIRYLWERPGLCREMGEAGRAKALQEYSEERYYERLMKVYEQAGAGGQT